MLSKNLKNDIISYHHIKNPTMSGRNRLIDSLASRASDDPETPTWQKIRELEEYREIKRLEAQTQRERPTPMIIAHGVRGAALYNLEEKRRRTERR